MKKPEDVKQEAKSTKESRFFIHTENGLTISVYALIVGLFLVMCVIIGLNIELVPVALETLLEVISPLLYGFLIAFMISPCVSFIEKKIFCKWKNKRQGLKHILSIVLAYLLIASIVVVGTIFMVPQIIDTYNQLSEQLSSNLVDLRNWIAGIADKLPGAEKSNSYIYFNISSDYRVDVTDLVLAESLNTPFGGFLKNKNTASQIEVQAMLDNIFNSIVTAFKEALPGMISSAWSILIGAKNILLGLIISVYFCVCRKSIVGNLNKLARAWMPENAYHLSERVITKAKGIFKDYIVVRILDSLIVALITFIGLLIVRNPYALLLSVVIGVSALIPFIGPVIGIALCTFIMFFVGIGYAIGFGAVMVGVQLLDDRIIEPLLNRGYSKHRLAGIWVFSAIVIMSGLFGLIGFLLGIPLFAFIYSIVKELCEKRLRSSGQSTDTESYGFVSFKMRQEPKKPPVIIEQWVESLNAEAENEESESYYDENGGGS